MKKSSFLFALSAASLLTLGTGLVNQLGWADSFEYNTLQWRFKLREKLEPQKPDPRVVLAGIDDFTTNQLGAWPLPRSRHAQVLAFLADEKPAVVAWDILFTEPTRHAPGEDDLMVQATRLFPHLITGATRDDNTPLAPPSGSLGPTLSLPQIRGDLSRLPQATNVQLPFDSFTREDGTPSASLLQAGEFGFVDCEPSFAGVRLHAPMLTVYQGRVFPSLSLQAALDYFQAKPAEVIVTLGKEIQIPRIGAPPLRIPINDRGEMLVNYRHHLEAFENISYIGLLSLLSGKAHLEQARAQNPNFDQQLKQLPALTGNIVVFGFVAKGFDTGPTPLQGNAPLVTVHLNALSNILQQDFLHPAPAWLWLPLLFVLLFALTRGLMQVALPLILPLGLFSLAAYFALSYIFFQFGHVWLPTALPLDALFFVTLISTAKLYFGESLQKQQIKTAMAAYLPEKVMERVLEHPDNLKLGGSKREVTVLFCDIRGFTKYCDKREPEEVVAVLNEYMEIMSNVIFRYEGTLDKYIGDCIMAFWNAPENQPDHAQRAVCCAMEMRYALANYKTTRAGIDTELFECGIGIHTGPALVGNVGSSRRLSYTAIGSTVNMAARLESLTKQFTSRVIISDATRAQISDEFTLTNLGEVIVPGFTQKTRLYAVEAQQDIGSALLVGKKVAQEANAPVQHIAEPLWPPAPLPLDAETDSDGKEPSV